MLEKITAKYYEKLYTIITLTDTTGIETRKPPPELFVPSNEECEEPKASMKNLVKRITVSLRAAFMPFKEEQLTRIEP